MRSQVQILYLPQIIFVFILRGICSNLKFLCGKNNHIYLNFNTSFYSISHPHEEDPFTTYIQEKLIELGYLEVATGVNDKTSQAAIKLFQEKSGLIVDGLVGENTFLQLMLAENPTDNNSSVTSSSAEDLVIDDKPPVWDEEQPPYASEIGSLFNLNMPSVTDNVGIVSYEVYVNGALIIVCNDIRFYTSCYPKI